jgi:hypothetical protein
VGVGTLAAFILAGCPLSATAAMYTNDTDWAGGNLTLANGDVISGVHTNLNQFSVPAGATVRVQPYTSGAAFGRALIYAQSASIEGNLRADGAGFGLGQGPGAASNGEGGPVTAAVAVVAMGGNTATRTTRRTWAAVARAGAAGRCSRSNEVLNELSTEN